MRRKAAIRALRSEDLATEFEAQHRRRFTEVVEFYDIPPERSHLVSGFVHRELPGLAASLGASLVVMGAINRDSLQHLCIGSSAERTLDRLPCDLLVVKPDWFHSPAP